MPPSPPPCAYCQDPHPYFTFPTPHSHSIHLCSLQVYEGLKLLVTHHKMAAAQEEYALYYAKQNAKNNMAWVPTTDSQVTARLLRCFPSSGWPFVTQCPLGSEDVGTQTRVWVPTLQIETFRRLARVAKRLAFGRNFTVLRG